MATKPDKIDVDTLVSAADRKSAASVIRKLLSDRAAGDKARADQWISFCASAKIPEREKDETKTDWNRKVRAIVDDIGTRAGLNRKANASDMSRMTTYAKCAPEALQEARKLIVADKRVLFGEKVLTFAASRIADGKTAKLAVTEAVKHYSKRKQQNASRPADVLLAEAIARFCRYAASSKGTTKDVDRARAVAEAYGKRGFTYDAIVKAKAK